MGWRTVIISEQAKLDYKMGNMVVRGYNTTKIFLDEIETLVIENSSVSLTSYLIAELTEKKIKVIFCDTRHNPIAELIPHHGSYDSSAKIRTQATWSQDIKAIIWQEIISEKIRKQCDFLVEIGKSNEAGLLNSYIGQVELSDATNREGHAAKVYFNALFGMEFTRSAETPINAALNYGYSIILSTFNRVVSANGYLTQLGIFHDNMFNHFNLSCDLMEPFRIIVDRYVYSLKPLNFEKEEKHQLWNLMSYNVRIDNTVQMLDNAITIYAKSVFEAINDGDPSKIKHYGNI